MTRKQSQIVTEIAGIVRDKFTNDTSGHDWYHMERVWKMARQLGEAEGADLFIVELAALLHDWADWKFSADQSKDTEEMKQLLRNHGATEDQIGNICEIIENVSFKGLEKRSTQSTLEGKVVQDADRLDAIGAIAIARVFAYGGHKGRPIYDPSIPLNVTLTNEQYLKNERSGLAHFFDKLLHLKDQINTESAKKIAEERHRYMEEYVERFLAEWDGKR